MADEIKHDASDPRRDDYNSCEDSPDLRSGQAMWQLKDNYKHMKSSMTRTSHSGMIIIARFPVCRQAGI